MASSWPSQFFSIHYCPLEYFTDVFLQEVRNTFYFNADVLGNMKYQYIQMYRRALNVNY